MRVEHNIEIDAAAQRVWNITLDVESWPQHTPTIESIERLDAGTTSTLAIEIDGPLAPIVGALVRRPILAAITRENQGIKQAAEAD